MRFLDRLFPTHRRIRRIEKKIDELHTMLLILLDDSGVAADAEKLRDALRSSRRALAAAVAANAPHTHRAE